MELRTEGGYDGNKPGTALALGYFDGVHLGHRQVIQAAVRAAGEQGLAPAVFTFTLNGTGGPKGKLILTNEQKHEVLAELGVEYCFEPRFHSFQALRPEAFFTGMLLRQYRMQACFCGADFQFGAHRMGDAALLGRLCEQNGIRFQAMPLACLQGEPISSSRIRAALAEGDVELAAALLGRPYELCQPVVRGRQIGSAHGFPTLNQHIPDTMQAPKFGVYITTAEIDGKTYPAATGYGPRPTVNGVEPTCETFVPGFAGDAYGKPVRLRFCRRIDDTRKFKDADELARAVHAWAEQALAYFATGDRA